MRRVKVIAITGGTGCGQSTASKLLGTKYNCKVIHADLIAKQIVDTNPVVKELIRDEFGAQYFNERDELKRKELGQYVFSNKNATQRLNSIVHPILVEELILEIEESQENQSHRCIIIDAALIYELALERYFDAVIVVYTPKQKRIQRVMKRDNITQKEVYDRMANQFDLAEKKSWADFVIDNSKSIEDLEIEIDKLIPKIKNLK